MMRFIPCETILAAIEKPEAADALRLYLNLLCHVLHGGTVIRTQAKLSEDLDVPEAEVERMVERLAAADLVEVKCPSPHLVIRLRSWSDSECHPRPYPQEAGSSGPLHEDVPVGSQQQPAASSKLSGEGGAGEGGELFETCRSLLGPGDEPGDLKQLVESYPVEIIRRALARVRATPDRQIRRSRLALFRYLLIKLNDETITHATNPHPHD